MEDPIYVIGHRNPDADAICSAIGYASYKQARGESRFQAARCGNSNARIDCILKEFDVSLPLFIGDVTPRVRDIMTGGVYKIRSDAVCAEALMKFDEYDVRTLPVVNDENQLCGILNVFDLGRYFIPRPTQTVEMRKVVTCINDIVRALDGKIITAVDPDREEELFVRVGAMDIRSFGKYYQEDKALARKSVIVVGDRYDIQQRSIQLGVRIVVITGGLPIDDDVLSLAKEKGVSIVSSPIDSASTSSLIRSATRINKVMQTTVSKFSPDARVSKVRQKIRNMATPAHVVVDEDDNVIGVFSKTDLLKQSSISLVLVDHNEISQAVPGAEQVRILEIIDHHRLGNPPTEQPILFVNRPLGSTSTIVAEMFLRDKIDPSPEVAGVLMGGIISDTLNLQGPTTTPTDGYILSWLENIAGISGDDFAKKIFASGSVILSETPENVIRSDMKDYTEGEIRFSVSQVEELGFSNFHDNDDALTAALHEVRKTGEYFFCALLVTDINTQNSLLLVAGPDEFIEHIKYPHNTHDAFELNGIVSRKKQLIPYLTGLIRAANVAAEALDSLS